MAPAAIPPLMSSDEVNLLVYSYLAESCLDHSAFTLYSESRLGDFLNSGEENPPAVPPTGQLIRILQKGLLYLQAEAKYRGEDIAANPPRLIGYEIPDTLPLPPLPKSLPPPSPPPVASSSKKRQAPLASSSAATAAIANANSAAAATTSSSNLKRKESSKNGDSNSNSNARSASEDAPGQTQAKKQRMAAKSPTGTASDSTTMRDAQATSASASTSTATENTESAAQASKESKAAVDTASKNKKGKGRATDSQGDADMSGGEGQAGSDSKPASANGSDKTNSTSAKTASTLVAAKSALPTTAAASSTTTTQATSSSTANTVPSNTSSSKVDGSNTSETRRSASPTTTTARKPNGISNLSKDKNRPRSASPNTSLRPVSNSSTFASSRNATSAQQPPTIDSSKPASSSSATTAQETTNKPTSSDKTSVPGPPPPAPKLEPKHVVKKNEVILLKGHTMPVQPCHWNPQVETLLATGSGDSTMRIWDVPAEVPGSPITSTVVCKHASGQRRSDVTALEWNVDGSLLASGSEDGIARIWTPSGDLHLVLSMHQRTIFCVKWNNTGSMLLTGSLDHSICLWDTGYGKVKQQWSTHADSILDLDWMTDDIFASCSMDKMINIHQVGRNTPVYRFKGHSDEVNCIRFCPTNRHLASCSDDNTVRVWSLQPVKSTLGLSEKDVKKEGSDDSSETPLNGDEKDKPFVVLRGHDKEVHAVSWCPKVVAGSPKLLASASFDATARIWDALTGTCLYIFTRHTDMVYSLAWQPEGNYLATGSNDKKMCVLKVPRSKKGSEEKENDASKYELSFEYEHPGPIYEICWHPTRDQIAVCGKYEGVNVVNFDVSKNKSA